MEKKNGSLVIRDDKLLIYLLCKLMLMRIQWTKCFSFSTDTRPQPPLVALDQRFCGDAPPEAIDLHLNDHLQLQSNFYLKGTRWPESPPPPPALQIDLIPRRHTHVIIQFICHRNRSTTGPGHGR